MTWIYFLPFCGSFFSLSYYCPSVQFSHSVVSDSLRPHESQHVRPPCPSPSPGVHSDSRPLSQWCHPAISSLVVPLFSCLQSLPAFKFFPMSQLFASGGHSTGVSALASFLPKKSQGWSPSEWTGWISLQGLGSPRVRGTKVFDFDKVQFPYFFFGCSCYMPYLRNHCLLQGHKDLRCVVLWSILS